jgi:hypothetical protein
MFLLSLVFLFVALVLIGVGVAIGLVACLIAGTLLSLGVISSSIFIGVRSRRALFGIRAFLLQCGVFAGIPAGAVCAWLAQSFFETYGSGWPVLVYGAIGGAVSGVVIALFLDFIWRRFHAWATARLSPTSSLQQHSADDT